MKIDKRVWAFIIGASFVIPAYFWLRAWVLGEPHPYFFYLSGVVFSFLVGFSITWINLKFVILLIMKWLPWTNDRKRITKRIIIEFLLTSANAAAIITIILLIFDRLFTEMQHGTEKEMFFSNIVVALIVNFIAMSIIEGNYIFKQWKISMVEAERLERERITSQFNALKNQVNPHFLFNSLNALSSLITVSPDKAQQFVAEFSKVYRYVLEKGDESVVELHHELEFIRSYYFLQKIRHGNDLSLHIRIDETHKKMLVPALSLQILVENAIKHNEVSAQNPLIIDIFEEKEFLVVKNNFQKRDEGLESTRIGLKNLEERYRYLSETKPEFGLINGFYVAKIPFIIDE